jgi:hypothetical protein
MVNGDKVWIEYFEPSNANGQGRLHIAKATHRYRGLQKPAQTKSLGDSDTCNVDVDCAIGDDYDYIKDHNKRSVALINLGNSICTGTLINNTSNDGTPYFLTADHCYSNPSSWAFFIWLDKSRPFVCDNSSKFEWISKYDDEFCDFEVKI